MKRVTFDLPAIGQALDSISWDWVSDNHPLLAEAIQTEMGRGANPDQVRRFVMQQTQRLELALRCEQAARWLAQSPA
jgi:hypothetical protein